jgi:hypothetical protein
MSKLTETIEVDCAPFYALHHAERYFTVHRRDVTPGTISLHVDFSKLKLPGGSQARHDVRVKHELVKESGKPDELAISWDPDDRTVPSFHGRLRAEAAGDEGKTLFLLDGSYTPPLGVAGAAFDLVVGRRIASATISALLEELKGFVESDYRTARATNLADSPKE